MSQQQQQHVNSNQDIAVMHPLVRPSTDKTHVHLRTTAVHVTHNHSKSFLSCAAYATAMSWATPQAASGPLVDQAQHCCTQYPHLQYSSSLTT
jgi:hypothetical protein